MFSMFQKSTKPNPKLIHELGLLSKQIIELNETDSELDKAIKGKILLTTIIVEVKRHYGISVARNSFFAKYLVASQDDDFDEIIEIIDKVSTELMKFDDLQKRGMLVYHWFVGEGNT